MATDLNQEFTRRRKRNSSPDHDPEHDMLTLSLSIQPSSSTNYRPPPPPLNFSPPPPPPPSQPLPPATAAVIYPQPLQAIHPLQQLPPSFYNIGLNIPVPPLPSDHHHHQQYLPVPEAAPVMYRPGGEASRPGPSSVRRTRQRRSPTGGQNNGESLTIPPPYPWATDRRAILHNLEELKSMEIRKISGDVRCKTCFEIYEMEFDLEQKFIDLGNYVAANRDAMRDRAPGKWMNPDLPTCKACGQENSMKPVISEDLDKVNWLFLLLGEMIGLCKLEQLKYLCKYTKNHCTGAKDRLVYLVYLTLCDQLVPGGPFKRRTYP